mgnify:CR=1 FL=1
MVELLVLAAGGIQRLRERIEAVGDGGKLLRAGPRQPHPVIALLEIGEAAGDAGERVEHPPEQEIENGDDRDVHDQRHRAERDGVAPRPPRSRRAAPPRSRPSRCAAPLTTTGTSRLAIGGGDQRCKPRPARAHPASRRRSPTDGGTASAERWGVLHPDPHVAHQPQAASVRSNEEFLRRHLLLHQIPPPR